MHVGTLSKAVGSHGGFVSGSVALKRLLLSRGRAGIYSTALPAPSVAAASAALRVATPALRQRLWDNVASLTAALSPPPPPQAAAAAATVVAAAADASAHAPRGAPQPPVSGEVPPVSGSPIVPIIVGSAEAALEAADALLARGFLVPAIRRRPSPQVLLGCASPSLPPTHRRTWRSWSVLFKLLGWSRWRSDASLVAAGLLDGSWRGWASRLALPPHGVTRGAKYTT